MEKESFELEYQNLQLAIERIPVPGQFMFKVWFPSKETAVFISRVTSVDKEKFWTSVPEGKEKFAEKIGLMIENYYRI